MSLRIAVGELEVRGVEIDAQTRCIHYHSALDVIAIRFGCCDEYYSCFECHEALADHPAKPWPRNRFDESAVLCGVCGSTLIVNEYMNCQSRCPCCNAAFNLAAKPTIRGTSKDRKFRWHLTAIRPRIFRPSPDLCPDVTPTAPSRGQALPISGCSAYAEPFAGGFGSLPNIHPIRWRAPHWLARLNAECGVEIRDICQRPIHPVFGG